MIVYLLTMTGVGDAGCCGVFFERSSANEHAERLYAASDGYHNFRIDEMELDVGYYPHGPLKMGYSAEKVPPRTPGTVDFTSLEEHDVFGDDANNDECSCGHIRKFHVTTEIAPSTRSVECTFGTCTCIVWDPV